MLLENKNAAIYGGGGAIVEKAEKLSSPLMLVSVGYLLRRVSLNGLCRWPSTDGLENGKEVCNA
jgi:hypothetical protein